MPTRKITSIDPVEGQSLVTVEGHDESGSFVQRNVYVPKVKEKLCQPTTSYTLGQICLANATVLNGRTHPKKH